MHIEIKARQRRASWNPSVNILLSWCGKRTPEMVGRSHGIWKRRRKDQSSIGKGGLRPPAQDQCFLIRKRRPSAARLAQMTRRRTCIKTIMHNRRLRENLYFNIWVPRQYALSEHVCRGLKYLWIWCSRNLKSTPNILMSLFRGSRICFSKR